MPASTSVDDTEGLRAQLQGARENAITKICDHKISDEKRFSVVTRMRRCYLDDAFVKNGPSTPLRGPIKRTVIHM